MRKLTAGLSCFMLFAGCNAASSSGTARSVCANLGASNDVIDNLFEIAQNDRDEGLSASESRELFESDCAEMCGDDDECQTECQTCTSAVVDEVYSN